MISSHEYIAFSSNIIQPQNKLSIIRDVSYIGITYTDLNIDIASFIITSWVIAIEDAVNK